MRALRGQSGFSMVEVMVVTLIVGIALAASIPSFSRFMRSSNLNSAADQVASHLRLLRQQSVAEGVPYIQIWSSTYYYYTIEDTNGDGYYSSGENYWGPFMMPKGTYLSALDGFSDPYVRFLPSGSLVEGGDIGFRNDRGKSITLTVLRPTGQVIIIKESADA
jgi:prepilin-type N-terminal cleavage/methylation domain-containing protein